MTESDIEQAERLVRIEAAIEALRADLARFLAEHVDHEKRIQALEREQKVHCTLLDNSKERMDDHLNGHDDKVESLSKRVNTWGGSNSVAAVIAAVIGWFR
jgi:hypothetical protein